MMVAVILVVMAAIALLVALRAARGQALLFGRGPDSASTLKPIDMEAFRNLVDPEDEAYLRSALSPAVFRRLRRQRLRAISAYVACIASNAAFLLRRGELARHSNDPAVATAGQELAAGALRLRLNAFLVLLRLRTEIWIPGPAIVRIVSAYEQLGTLGGHLARLQSSAPSGSVAVRP
jgi:hypothetical protein